MRSRVCHSVKRVVACAAAVVMMSGCAASGSSGVSGSRSGNDSTIGGSPTQATSSVGTPTTAPASPSPSTGPTETSAPSGTREDPRAIETSGGLLGVLGDGSGCPNASESLLWFGFMARNPNSASIATLSFYEVRFLDERGVVGRSGSSGLPKMWPGEETVIVSQFNCVDLIRPPTAMEVDIELTQWKPITSRSQGPPIITSKVTFLWPSPPIPGTAEVRGEVLNEGRDPIPSAGVKVVLLDEDDNPVGYGGGLIVENLVPGRPKAVDLGFVPRLSQPSSAQIFVSPGRDGW